MYQSPVDQSEMLFDGLTHTKPVSANQDNLTVNGLFELERQLAES